MGKLLTLDVLGDELAAHQSSGQHVVLTNGVFDLMHYGHVQYLRAARALGDLLVVAVNGDDSVRCIKGPRRPLVPERERAALVAELGCVDYVTIFGDDTASHVVDALRPDVYVKGADYAGSAHREHTYLLRPEELRAALAGDAGAYPELAGLAERLPEAAVVAGYGGCLALLSYLPGHSTSELIQRIVERYGASS
jgi:D-glycero-beta-D-manno-heptose 1-phosphate adenylyltransferase